MLSRCHTSFFFMSKSTVKSSIPSPIMLCGVLLEQILIFENKAVPCRFSSCEEGVWCKIVHKILRSFM